jgi:hypothetical protein
LNVSQAGKSQEENVTLRQKIAVDFIKTGNIEKYHFLISYIEPPKKFFLSLF